MQYAGVSTDPGEDYARSTGTVHRSLNAMTVDAAKMERIKGHASAYLRGVVMVGTYQGGVPGDVGGGVLVDEANSPECAWVPEHSRSNPGASTLRSITMVSNVDARDVAAGGEGTTDLVVTMGRRGTIRSLRLKMETETQAELLFALLKETLVTLNPLGFVVLMGRMIVAKCDVSNGVLTYSGNGTTADGWYKVEVAAGVCSVTALFESAEARDEGSAVLGSMLRGLFGNTEELASTHAYAVRSLQLPPLSSFVSSFFDDASTTGGQNPDRKLVMLKSAEQEMPAVETELLGGGRAFTVVLFRDGGKFNKMLVLYADNPTPTIYVARLPEWALAMLPTDRPLDATFNRLRVAISKNQKLAEEYVMIWGCVIAHVSMTKTFAVRATIPSFSVVPGHHVFLERQSPEIALGQRNELVEFLGGGGV